ncbi:MAG: DeoR/GlpR transcriptional regulator [Alistipes sp.]|nr:DeoR/GlpR transcriptional regulator [Alistipes sp.]MBQ8779314.1 DeoR/GlpR transcriptional regulator [Alistipes sp.]MBR2169552.1 DeoR/GlpR transcriptional regulator [Alistipes sp.]MBR2332417.1 DeoR/GlpR transcriptional regulator [Alistipes sp.]MBR2398463.1 DeoR/GlpR transcriptional regulator [Alistipes sp.]
MTINERHDLIIKELDTKGQVSVTELSTMLNVSEVTIRKDLTMLEQGNRLYRAHGKAIKMSPYINDRDVNVKFSQYPAEKTAIGKKAVSLIEANDSIIIASGTTVEYFAREVYTDESLGRLTVITSALNVASILAKNRNFEVVQLGGIVRGTALSAVGSDAEHMLENFNSSKLFIGVDGIDIEYGLSTTNLLEANLNRVMIRSAQKTIVLCDSSKFGRRGFSRICEIDDVDQIITDAGIPPHTLEALQQRGIEVTIVEM